MENNFKKISCDEGKPINYCDSFRDASSVISEKERLRKEKDILQSELLIKVFYILDSEMSIFELQKMERYREILELLK
jgi:hypothetical protein